jgi:hypothetical protein
METRVDGCKQIVVSNGQEFQLCVASFPSTEDALRAVEVAATSTAAVFDIGAFPDLSCPGDSCRHWEKRGLLVQWDGMVASVSCLEPLERTDADSLPRTVTSIAADVVDATTGTGDNAQLGSDAIRAGRDSEVPTSDVAPVLLSSDQVAGFSLVSEGHTTWGTVGRAANEDTGELAVAQLFGSDSGGRQLSAIYCRHASEDAAQTALTDLAVGGGFLPLETALSSGVLSDLVGACPCADCRFSGDPTLFRLAAPCGDYTFVLSSTDPGQSADELRDSASRLFSLASMIAEEYSAIQVTEH